MTTFQRIVNRPSSATFVAPTDPRNELAGQPADIGTMDRIYSELRPQRGPSRLMGRVSLILLVSTVVHIGVFLADDRPWAGAVSWRKPIVFAASFALMAWAVGWVLDRLPERRGAKIISRVVATTSFIEITLISGQTWRGEPSHFNPSAEGSIIFGIMGQAVMVLSIALVALLVWAIIDRPTDPAVRIAAIAGMAVMMTGLGIGSWLVSLGTAYTEEFNQVPESVTYGEAGLPKFPHGVAFHGIHVFAIAAVLLGVAGASRTAKVRWMSVIVTAYVGLLSFSVLQTFEGRSPSDLVATSGSLAGTSLAVLGASMAALTVMAFRSPSKSIVENR